jgi:hypothetical protein
MTWHIRISSLNHYTVTGHTLTWLALLWQAATGGTGGGAAARCATPRTPHGTSGRGGPRFVARQLGASTWMPLAARVGAGSALVRHRLPVDEVGRS